MITAQDVLFLLGRAEDEAENMRETATHNDWEREQLLADADKVDDIAMRMTPLADRIAALVNEKELQKAAEEPP